MTNKNEFAEKIFKAAQSPQFWFWSAENLRDGAEAILAAEIKFEVPYFRVHERASMEAVAIMANSGGNVDGVSEIEARVPNYPVAQLLYAYAIENLLKGIIVANDRSLINDIKLNHQLQSHDLLKLCQDAGFVIHIQERPVAEALSQLSV